MNVRITRRIGSDYRTCPKRGELVEVEKSSVNEQIEYRCIKTASDILCYNCKERSNFH